MTSIPRMGGMIRWGILRKPAHTLWAKTNKEVPTPKSLIHTHNSRTMHTISIHSQFMNFNMHTEPVTGILKQTHNKGGHTVLYLQMNLVFYLRAAPCSPPDLEAAISYKSDQEQTCESDRYPPLCN